MRNLSPIIYLQQGLILPPGRGLSKSFWIIIKRLSYAFEELSEVSLDHQFLAYTMYDKDNDYFVLSVRNFVTGSLCDKPGASRVANLAWAMDGQALLYTDVNKRPYRVFCSIVGSEKDGNMILEELDENVYVNIWSTIE